MNNFFRVLSNKIARFSGSVWSFIAAMALVLGWLVSGPVFGFSQSWQLFINTVTTITTFLMVFLIQNTQNRDAKAVHLKLDELLRSAKGARLSLLDIEDVSDDILDEFQFEFKNLYQKYQTKQAQKTKSTNK